MEILLIEENLENASVMVQALKWGEVQCRVSLVSDGEEAISFLYREKEFARAPTPDLILLDMQLPAWENEHLLAEIQANDELKDIPVVVLDGLPGPQASLQVQELHLDGFLPKPVELHRFIEMVKSRRRSWLAELVQRSSASCQDRPSRSVRDESFQPCRV
jgi:CheY-like chemotaxis protein